MALIHSFLAWCWTWPGLFTVATLVGLTGFFAVFVLALLHAQHMADGDTPWRH